MATCNTSISELICYGPGSQNRACGNPSATGCAVTKTAPRIFQRYTPSKLSAGGESYIPVHLRHDLVACHTAACQTSKYLTVPSYAKNCQIPANTHNSNLFLIRA